MNRPLSEKELEEAAANISDVEVDPYYDSDDSRDADYKDSDASISSQEYCTDYSGDEDVQSDNNTQIQNENKNTNAVSINCTDITASQATTSTEFIWHRNIARFSPKRSLPQEYKAVIMATLNRGSTKLECLYKLFPKSLIMQISCYTYKRSIRKVFPAHHREK